jgi:hypothetical protein
MNTEFLYDYLKKKTLEKLACWFLAELIFSTLKMEAICSSETSVDNGLHDVISQNMTLFMKNLLVYREEILKIILKRWDGGYELDSSGSE